MKYLLSIFKPLFVTCSSIFFINKFNIFSFINFIPEDKKFDVYLILYITIIEIVLNYVIQKFKEIFYSELSCLFYSDIKKVSKDNDPYIIFDYDVGVCYVNCVIKIKGAYRSFKDNNIKICLPSWVSLQPMSQSIVRFEEMEGNIIIIPLDNIIPNNKKNIENIEYRFKLGFIREELSGNYEITLIPEFTKKRLIKIEFNKITLST